ncbi:alpha/beta fold hydrolase [Agromyces aerolatus]|uniref:alpha/beta fold hydrolase n=1 Tax=Agromyces sp. LY-1074 TaxID=3074080 RepID=UPI002862768E|nr:MULTISPECIES: alpha/beta fold hydrolase [unclassified Agromyces]MDR5699432.1 alpha/beta fold hydrolase [Agromyces sp. LY-1074]MDR5705728.1 alpha/beta fold hydrolase [Agromyces sp. LY-1358]
MSGKNTPRATAWGELGAVAHRVEYVDAAGWRTRCLVAGEGDETLFLLPGTGGHLEAYTRNIAALARNRRVIAYDYPGHGYTTLTDHDLELPEYVAHLAALMEVYDVERAHLSGESLGGWIAVKFAAEHPDRVERLVLNTPGGTMARPEVMARIRDLSQAAADDPSPERVRSRLEWLMARADSVTDELVDIRRAIYSREGFADSMRHILCLQDPEVRARNLITDAELESIAVPTLVVWTSDDPSGPAGAGLHMAERIPGGRFELIEDAGHWPQWEQWRRFNALLTDFLDREAA